MPGHRIDFRAPRFIASQQPHQIRHELGVKHKKHHLEIEMQAPVIEVHSSEERKVVIDRNGFGVQQPRIKPQDLDARRPQSSDAKPTAQTASRFSRATRAAHPHPATLRFAAPRPSLHWAQSRALK